MAGSKSNFEEAMTKLEKIVEELEQGDFSLEVSMKKFDQGLVLGNVCKGMLDKAEQKVKVLIENAEGELEEKDSSHEL